ncbi:CinA family protein [Celeribacter sp.]|uniref:CinA family protein n=1 Tax=Celeribacter sp. TaxID=1890673 RepID=UPI003A8EBCF2
MPPGSEAPDLTRLATDVLAAARARGVIIATAESCTGGLIIGALTEIAGSSDVVDRGFITYSNAAKTEMLGVRPATLDAYGAVSEQVAREMAEGACAQSSAPLSAAPLPADRLALAVTGIAGPGGSDHKPEGRVCFGLAYAGRGTVVETVEFGALGRTQVRRATVAHALGLALMALTD